jgi:hypothetical protein
MGMKILSKNLEELQGRLVSLAIDSGTIINKRFVVIVVVAPHLLPSLKIPLSALSFVSNRNVRHISEDYPSFNTTLLISHDISYRGLMRERRRREKQEKVKDGQTLNEVPPLPPLSFISSHSSNEDQLHSSPSLTHFSSHSSQLTPSTSLSFISSHSSNEDQLHSSPSLNILPKPLTLEGSSFVEEEKFHPFPLLLESNVSTKSDYVGVLIKALSYLSIFNIRVANVVGDNLKLQVDAFSLNSQIFNLKERLLDSLNEPIPIQKDKLFNFLIVSRMQKGETIPSVITDYSSDEDKETYGYKHHHDTPFIGFQRCMCHSLNLAFQHAATKNLFLQELITQLKEVVHHLRQHTVRAVIGGVCPDILKERWLSIHNALLFLEIKKEKIEGMLGGNNFPLLLTFHQLREVIMPYVAGLYYFEKIIFL